jgi:hypothetical protein
MKEHPIIFSGPMVLALLAGRKSVTRRLSKQWLKVKSGDRLWAREAYGIGGARLIDPCLNFRADGAQSPLFGVKPGWWRRAEEAFGVVRSEELLRIRNGWIPSIHMPRWASRITLEVLEDARLERLQDITEDEAKAEGIGVGSRATAPGDSPNICVGCGMHKKSHIGISFTCFGSCGYVFSSATYRGGFAFLWDQLHTKPGERWDDNPEVVRVGPFKVL